LHTLQRSLNKEFSEEKYIRDCEKILRKYSTGLRSKTPLGHAAVFCDDGQRQKKTAYNVSRDNKVIVMAGKKTFSGYLYLNNKNLVDHKSTL
jgi:recombinational DNA repair protein RecR